MWVPASGWRSRRIFNAQEDVPMILSLDSDDSGDKVHKLFEMIETLGRFGSKWKTSSFILAECSLSDYFTKTDQRLSRLPQAVRELAETPTRDLNVWRVCSVLVQIVACCSAGFR